jgi:hypothetical protein
MPPDTRKLMPIAEVRATAVEQAVAGPLRPARFGWANQWDDWQRLAAVVWLVLVTVIAVRGWLSPSNTVYPIYAQAARDWVAGDDIYLPRGSPYRYSPLVAVLFLPLSRLNDPLGGTIWRLVNASAFLAGFAWFLRTVLAEDCSRRQRGILFLLSVPLSLGSLNNAQSNALVLGLLLAALAAGMGKRLWLSSGLTALACLFKVYPIALGLLLAVRYRRQFLLPLAFWLLCGLAVPFALGESSYVARQYNSWLHHLRTDDRQGLELELWYRDVRLLCHLCHISSLPGPSYPALQMAVACGIAVICWGAGRTGLDEQIVLPMILSLAVCWMTLFGSATESCTYILLAPSLSWSLVESWSNPGSAVRRWALTVSFSIFTITQAAVWFPHGKALHALGLHPLAGLLFFLAILDSTWHAFRQRKGKSLPGNAESIAAAA